MIGLLILVVIVVAVMLLAAAKAKSRAGAEEGSWPFYAKKPLSIPEQILYFRLCNSLPENIVLAQVGLSRLLGVKQGNNFRSWYNRISQMSVDFVVCSKDSRIVAVIELDDASHEREDRKVVDARKDKALNAAGVRVIRWQAKSLPDDAAIKAVFQPDKTFQPLAAEFARST